MSHARLLLGRLGKGSSAIQAFKHLRKLLMLRVPQACGDDWVLSVSRSDLQLSQTAPWMSVAIKR